MGTLAEFLPIVHLKRLVNMAASEAAYLAEKIIGHDDNAITEQDVSDYQGIGAATMMKALVWRGKNKVEIGLWALLIGIMCGETSKAC